MSLKRTAGRAIALSSAFLLLAGIGSCDKRPLWKQHAFEEKSLGGTPSDVELPEALWKKIEELGHGGGGAEPAAASGGGHGGGGGGGSSSPAQPLPTEFSLLKVYLVERNRGILGRANYEISYTGGGGELDLADFVAPLNGSFYFVAEFLPEVEAATKHVYFLSNSIVRKKRNERVGSGCNTYFDVTSSFQKALLGQGFLVNTSEQRHVSALVGTYFFAAVHDGKLHLASLSVKDSRQRALHCRP